MGKSMLRLNEKGIISWLLSQLALLLAAAILLASIASITFYNDWKKEAEIRVIAMNIASEIASMDLKSYPNSTDYFLPIKPYKIYLSPSYIRIERNDGTIHKNINVVVSMWVKPYIEVWKNGTDLHENLFEKYGHYGNISDYLPNEAKEDLKEEMDRICRELAARPFILDVNKPLHIEKDIIYFEDGKMDILIVSQEET